MRLTIERMRMLVLGAGVLLLAALVVFLAVAKWKNPFNRRDLPQRLGIEIQQEANGVTYTQAHGGHTLFKIHASKVVQLKQGNAVLHDVKIELYGEDGSRVDRIEGSEFEYDQQAGTAKAAGAVEITLMQPGVAPAVAPKAAAGKELTDKLKSAPVASMAQTAARGEVHVKTSGLTFDQKSGIAKTDQHVDFSMVQGTGSAIGAAFDSDRGLLVLDRAVVLSTERGAETIVIHAQHAEFERESQLCLLHAVTANFAATGDFSASQATAEDAKILFREDGSADRFDAMNGFTLTSATGSRLEAPTGNLEFNEHNQPRHGHLEGGVTMHSENMSGDRSRKLNGAAPTADLEFSAQGQLRHAHMEKGLLLDSEETSISAQQAQRVSRHWRSPVADIDFFDAAHGKVALSSVHGTGGVVVTGESQRGKEAPVLSKFSASEVTGKFGPDSALTEMTGIGQAKIEEITATGARQSTSGDHMVVHFAVETVPGAKQNTKHGADADAQVQSATVDGHVVLTEEPAAKPGTPPQAVLRATSGRADYEGQGEWLHLTMSPRIEDGALQITAVKVDVSRLSGDAFAHGDVKASWTDIGTGSNGQSRSIASQGNVALGGQGPAHVVAAEAQLHQATGEATFRGQARLWQQANSVTAPVIVLDRMRQTMVARTENAAEPVRAVLVSAGPVVVSSAESALEQGKSSQPAVIRVRGGDLRYSDLERKAVMHGGVLGSVVAETATATSVSNEVEVTLQPAGNSAARSGNQVSRPVQGQAQVDRMIARGHVVLTSGGRRGTGEQLVYNGAANEYVLTGTTAQPPRMNDPARGTVSGEALIFHGRDDSVSVEGGGQKTVTETTAPR